VLRLHFADLGELVDRRVEVGGGDHEADHPGADLARVLVVDRLRLGVGAGDVAALGLDEGADLEQLRVEQAAADGEGHRRFADDRRALQSRHHVVRQLRVAVGDWRLSRATARAVT
jgi:hypothetical protein